MKFFLVAEDILHFTNKHIFSSIETEHHCRKTWSLHLLYKLELRISTKKMLSYDTRHFLPKEILQEMILKSIWRNVIIFERRLWPLHRTCRGCRGKNHIHWCCDSPYKSFLIENKANLNVERTGWTRTVLWWISPQFCKNAEITTNNIFRYHMTPAWTQKLSLHFFYKNWSPLFWKMVPYDTGNVFSVLMISNILWRYVIIRAATLGTPPRY